MKNIKVLQRFSKTRRSAIAVTMAIALVPLVLLIGIAVDVTFLSQDRLQTAFAAEAAAASATRIAAATYSQEVAINVPAPKNESAADAAEQSINSADVVGNLWFDANLGNYSIGSLNSRNTTTKYDGNTNGSVNASAPPNFTATVATSSSYPPIFNSMFGQTTNQWVYSSGGMATTQFAYVQLLLMLDTSSSMLIGADSPANSSTGENDVLPMEQGTVCPDNGTLANFGTYPLIEAGTTYLSAIDGNGTYTHPALDPSGQPQSQNYLFNEPDGDDAQIQNAPNYLNATSNTDVGEQCAKNTGFQRPGPNNTTLVQVPAAPCALACHYSKTPSPATGYTEDYYGLARKEGVTLRLDVLFDATEEVIQDMISSEAVPDQFALGVYQFNTDVFPIVDATLGGKGSLPEATTDLSEALTLVQQDDYKKTPTENKIPQIINENQNYLAPNPNNASEGGDTNFPMSLTDLQDGNAWPQKDGQNQPLTAAGQGDTEKTPQKFIFIVTDGMEDDSGSNGDGNGNPLYNVMGEMTSITEENKGAGVCSYLKNTLNYTVYVLYVDYEPVSDASYYSYPGARPPNGYTTEDYPTYSSPYNTTVQNLSAVEGANGPTFGTAPIAEALRACSSDPNNDFMEASDSASIEADLTLLLKKALASTIRLTN
jgi:Flp pilus assembly protein TadG